MDDIDRDDEKFNLGVDHVVTLLASYLNVTDWVASDGSEDYDTDLVQTLENILEAKGLYDRDTGTFATLRAQSPAATASPSRSPEQAEREAYRDFGDAALFHPPSPASSEPQK